MPSYSLSKQPREVMLELASKIRTIRKAKKWSQAALADRSGVSLGSLKRFETQGEISLISLLKLAHTLGRLEEFNDLFQPTAQGDLNQLFSS